MRLDDAALYFEVVAPLTEIRGFFTLIGIRGEVEAPMAPTETLWSPSLFIGGVRACGTGGRARG